MSNRTRTTATESRPPEDYGGGDQWADEGDSFYVPPELRRRYSEAVVTDTDRETFDAGVEVYEMGSSTATSDTDTKGNAILERDQVPTGRRLHGRDGWQEYVHGVRLNGAAAQHRFDEMTAATEARKLTCPTCGTREHASAMFAHELSTGRAVVCVRCDPHVRRVVDDLAHRAWLDEHGEQLATLLG